MSKTHVITVILASSIAGVLQSSSSLNPRNQAKTTASFSCLVCLRMDSVEHDMSKPLSSKSRSKTITDLQFALYRKTPPQPTHALVQTWRKHLVHIHKQSHAFSRCTIPSRHNCRPSLSRSRPGTQPKLLPQKAHNTPKILVRTHFHGGPLGSWRRCAGKWLEADCDFLGWLRG